MAPVFHADRQGVALAAAPCNSVSWLNLGLKIVQAAVSMLSEVLPL